MAERRMFAKTIVLSDAFLDMPMSARCLYFTLGMFADDDGFVNSPRSIMRQTGCSDDDMKVLIAKKFVLLFESGVIVIKHWRINNYLRSDRYSETKYTDEKKMLTVNESGAYSLGIPTGIPNNGVPSIEEVSINKGSTERGKFKPPTVDDVKAYCEEKEIHIDANRFVDYYTMNGWKVGKNPMKDWKAGVRNWASRDKQHVTDKKRNYGSENYEQKPIPKFEDLGNLIGDF